MASKPSNGPHPDTLKSLSEACNAERRRERVDLSLPYWDTRLLQVKISCKVLRLRQVDIRRNMSSLMRFLLHQGPSLSFSTCQRMRFHCLQGKIAAFKKKAGRSHLQNVLHVTCRTSAAPRPCILVCLYLHPLSLIHAPLSSPVSSRRSARSAARAEQATQLAITQSLARECPR